MSSSNTQSAVASSAKALPKDAQLMASILKDMGVTEYEPKVINQMLEFTYRYVTDILDESKAYSSHANKKTVDCDDVALAVHSKMDNSFTTPPPRELLLELARSKNSQPLPLIKQGIGLRLPPDRFCFLSPNYRVKNQTTGSTAIQSAGTGAVTASSRGITSSLQANAIQAALGGGRKSSQTSKPSQLIGTPSTASMMSVINKSAPRPSINMLATQGSDQVASQQIPRGPNPPTQSFVSLQQQQQQQQSAGSSIMMVRPGTQTSSLPSMGMKRKLDDD